MRPTGRACPPLGKSQQTSFTDQWKTARQRLLNSRTPKRASNQARTSSRSRYGLQHQVGTSALCFGVLFSRAAPLGMRWCQLCVTESLFQGWWVGKIIPNGWALSRNGHRARVRACRDCDVTTVQKPYLTVTFRTDKDLLVLASSLFPIIFIVESFTVACYTSLFDVETKSLHMSFVSVVQPHGKTQFGASKRPPTQILLPRAAQILSSRTTVSIRYL